MTATCFIMLALSGLNITFGKDAAAAADRARGASPRWSQWAQVRAQLSELPVHHRRRADLPDVDRRQHPEPRRRRMDQARRRHRRQRSSAGLSLQCRPEDDLLDRRARRRRGGGHRLPADVPVLRHRHRRHAAGPDRPRHRRRCCSSPPCSAHIYIGTIGMEGAFEAMGTAGRRQLGEAAPQPLARGGDRRAPGPTSRRRRAGARTPAE